MFLQLNHKNLDVYKISRELLNECYKATKELQENLWQKEKDSTKSPEVQ